MPESDDDFLPQMLTAVREETNLWELPLGSTDKVPSGDEVHGPWSPRACGEVMLRWLSQNWIELYMPNVPKEWNLTKAEWRARAVSAQGVLVLARSDSVQLLHEPSRWTMDSEDGQVALSLTTSGEQTSHSDWVAATAVTRSQ
jgi:hypothetical protein